MGFGANAGNFGNGFIRGFGLASQFMQQERTWEEQMRRQQAQEAYAKAQAQAFNNSFYNTQPYVNAAQQLGQDLNDPEFGMRAAYKGNEPYAGSVNQPGFGLYDIVGQRSTPDMEAYTRQAMAAAGQYGQAGAAQQLMQQYLAQSNYREGRQDRAGEVAHNQRIQVENINLERERLALQQARDQLAADQAKAAEARLHTGLALEVGREGRLAESAAAAEDRAKAAEARLHTGLALEVGRESRNAAIAAREQDTYTRGLDDRAMQTRAQILQQLARAHPSHESAYGLTQWADKNRSLLVEQFGPKAEQLMGFQYNPQAKRIDALFNENREDGSPTVIPLDRGQLMDLGNALMIRGGGQLQAPKPPNAPSAWEISKERNRYETEALGAGVKGVPGMMEKWDARNAGFLANAQRAEAAASSYYGGPSSSANDFPPGYGGGFLPAPATSPTSPTSPSGPAGLGGADGARGLPTPPAAPAGPGTGAAPNGKPDAQRAYQTARARGMNHDEALEFVDLMRRKGKL